MSGADELVLALDQGGSSSRALVFDHEGHVVARAQREVAETRPAEDRVEQDPEELVRSLEDCVADVVRQLGPGSERPRAAGLATQRSSALAWDRVSGRALTNVLSWQDRRAAAWLAEFEPHAADVTRRTGLRLSPHYGASKLRWCLDHVRAVQDARANGTLVLGPLAAFLAQRLGHARVPSVDPANASRTLLWNLHERDWDDELCRLFGVPRELLPRCTPTSSAYGMLRWGDLGVPLQQLTGDQAAALFAHGPPTPEVLHANLGTGAFVLRTVYGDAPEIEGLLRSVAFGLRERSFCALEGTINGAGSALALVARETGLGDVEAELDGALRTSGELPLYLNGVSGLAAPFWRSSFRSRFVGRGSAMERLAAAAESIAFLVREIALAMETRLAPAQRVRATGGLARSEELCQLLADVLAIPVERPAETEATARGIALMLGVPPALDAASTRTFTPGPRAAERRERFTRWGKALRSALACER
jgi:glycerol kinase